MTLRIRLFAPRLSAFPSARSKRNPTQSPFRFSMRAFPIKHNLASVPELFRYNRDSGFVVEACVSLVRFSPWKFTVGLFPPPSGGRSDPSFFRKLFNDAND